MTAENIDKLGRLLQNSSLPLKQRFRALFTLKNLGGSSSIKYIGECFSDKSALLKHELAYCLGQMKNEMAVPILLNVLEDETQEIVVRHEAAEALGAIAAIKNDIVIRTLKKYEHCETEELAETCQLALGRFKYLTNNNGVEYTNIYGTVDPTPPSTQSDLETLRTVYLNDDECIFERYKAMFALRNINTEQSVHILTKGFQSKSILFRHEVAFVLGQLQHPTSIPALIAVVENDQENDIVRHECIEALGSIGMPECIQIIKKYLNDEYDLVRESCEVALDICDYNNSSEFQYANGLCQISCQ